MNGLNIQITSCERKGDILKGSFSIYYWYMWGCSIYKPIYLKQYLNT